MSLDVTPLVDSSTKIIKSYSDDGFVINNEKISDNIIIYYDKLLNWSFTDNDDIYTSLVSAVLVVNNQSSDKIELLILGTGKTILHIPEAVKNQFRENNISLEIVDSGAACRTYNSLIAEGRKVAAAILKSNYSVE